METILEQWVGIPGADEGAVEGYAMDGKDCWSCVTQIMRRCRLEHGGVGCVYGCIEYVLCCIVESFQAPRPSTGPHKLRESLPLILILRNRLKYALTKAEANAICKQSYVKVDGKVRTDLNFPAGFMGTSHHNTLVQFSAVFACHTGLCYSLAGRVTLRHGS